MYTHLCSHLQILKHPVHVIHLTCCFFLDLHWLFFLFSPFLSFQCWVSKIPLFSLRRGNLRTQFIRQSLLDLLENKRRQRNILREKNRESGWKDHRWTGGKKTSHLKHMFQWTQRHQWLSMPFVTQTSKTSHIIPPPWTTPNYTLKISQTNIIVRFSR